MKMTLIKNCKRVGLICFLLPGTLSMPVQAHATLPDTLLNGHIQAYFTKETMKQLRYPQSVAKFYELKGYRSQWVRPSRLDRQTLEALLLLDCVLQYGLSKTDYHPGELNHNRLRAIDTVPGSDLQRARFDVLLSDALFCLMNDLHYGKANTAFGRNEVDAGAGNFRAGHLLDSALASGDFMSAVLSAEPLSPSYQALRRQLVAVLGLEVYDCDLMPKGIARTISVNLERERWLALNAPARLTINIPAFTLTDEHNGRTKTHRVIVGKPTSQTPELRSSVTHFTTMPEWAVPKNIWIRELLPAALKDPSFLERNNYEVYDARGKHVAITAAKLAQISKDPGKYRVTQSAGCDNALGQVVFRFDNPYSIYLHDTPNKSAFTQPVRALSHGCIRLQDAMKLAKALMEADGQPEKARSLDDASNLQTETFRLGKPVTLQVVYLTCRAAGTKLIRYPDIYQKDAALEARLLN